MAEVNDDQIIETVTEDGEKVQFKLFDIVEFEEKEYAFLDRKYSFDNVMHANGIWGGNGQARITLLKLFRIGFTSAKYNINILYTFIWLKEIIFHTGL